MQIYIKEKKMEKELYIKKSFIEKKDTKVYILSNGFIIRKFTLNFFEQISYVVSTVCYNPKYFGAKTILVDGLNTLNDIEMLEVFNFLSKKWNQSPDKILITEGTKKINDVFSLTMTILSNGISKKFSNESN